MAHRGASIFMEKFPNLWKQMVPLIRRPAINDRHQVDANQMVMVEA
jgi:hypothetical protein